MHGQNAAGTWLRIRLDSGVEGWMSRVFTNFIGTMPYVREVILPPVTVPASAILNWCPGGEPIESGTITLIVATADGAVEASSAFEYEAP